MLTAAFVTFAAFWILTRHLSPQFMRRYVMPNKGKIDVCLHLSVVILFHGTFTGLMQAEAAAIMMSLYLLSYRKLFGFERRVKGRWVRFPGSMKMASS